MRFHFAKCRLERLAEIGTAHIHPTVRYLSETGFDIAEVNRESVWVYKLNKRGKWAWDSNRIRIPVHAVTSIDHRSRKRIPVIRLAGRMTFSRSTERWSYTDQELPEEIQLLLPFKGIELSSIS